MAHVKNLSKEVLTTITAGNIGLGEVKEIKDWELPLIEALCSKFEIVEKPAEEKKAPKKKGKK